MFQRHLSLEGIGPLDVEHLKTIGSVPQVEIWNMERSHRSNLAPDPWISQWL